MKKLFTIVMLLNVIFLVFSTNFKFVGGVNANFTYNYGYLGKSEVRNRLNVYVSENGDIVFDGSLGNDPYRGFIYQKDKAQVINLLHKYFGWEETAKKERVDVTKLLGTFIKEGLMINHGIKLTFISTDSGMKSNLSLDIIDYYQAGNEVKCTISSIEVKELLSILENIPKILEDFKKDKEKSDLFK